jgi:hypothetical protein
VIFALRAPALLLGLAAGFLAGMLLRVALRRALLRVGRLSGPRPVSTTRAAVRWPAYLDPYGVVAAVVAGPGWAPPTTSWRRGRWPDLAPLVSALVAHAALTALGLAGFVAAGGTLPELGLVDVSSVLHGSVDPRSAALSVALGFAEMNLACGLLALVPIPPLELGVVLWRRLPRSAGARRLAYRLLEEQWGVAAVLLLLLLPLAGGRPVLLSVIDAAGRGILGAL